MKLRNGWHVVFSLLLIYFSFDYSLTFANPVNWQKMVDKAQTLRYEDKFEEAEMLYKQAEQEVIKHGEFSEGHIYVLSELASFYENKGNLDEAQHIYQKIIEALRQKNDPARTGYLQMSGDIYFKSNNLKEGLRCYEEALVIEQQEFGADSNTVWNDQKKLVRLYLEYGEQEKAETLLKQMITLRKNDETEKKLSAVGTYVDLARLQVKTGKIPDAKSNYQKAVTLIKFGTQQYPESIYTQMVKDMLPTIQKELNNLK